MITAYQVRQLMPPTALVIAADATYARPTVEWLQGDFWDWFKGARWKLGLHRWHRRHDCDDFARAYCQACADAWALTPGAEEVAEAVAVGEFYYNNAGTPHAIVAAVTDMGLVFIEPQTSLALKLTDAEIKSCFYARF